MRSSIRNQILIPLVAVQAVTVATIALVAARMATNNVEVQVTDRLRGVVETLGRSNFPLTSGVLDKMRGLSGAQFLVTDDAGNLLESTWSGLDRLPTNLRTLPSRTSLDSPGTSPKVEINDERFFATSIRSNSGSTLLILYPESAWQRARWEAIWPTLALGILSLIPMALMTGAVAHKLSRRLRTVEGKVAAIASGDLRDLEARRSGDEVDDLIQSVNQMAGQLRQLRETIRRTERAGILAQLAAGLAHQLRNAATGAKMAVQLHARRCPSFESDGSLGVALRQLALCEAQIKGLLTMGQSPGQSIARLDSHELIEDVLRLAEPTAKHVGLNLDHPDREGPHEVHGDGDRLRAALLNLILNAIEAAGPQGNVSVSAVIEESFARFDVIDDGPGPLPELAATMFEPFVTGKPEGVGLGLALASRVAFDHGGGLSWSRVDDQTIFSLRIARDRFEEGEPDEPNPGR